MRIRFLRLVVLTAAVVGLTSASGHASALQSLPVGSIGEGSTAADSPAVFSFRADGAGFLTVVVRGSGGADLWIAVGDSSGQTLPEGRSDQDIGGDQAAEQVTVMIPRAGDYQVQVQIYSGSAVFQVGAAWIPFPSVEIAPDPDGSPDSAVMLVPGTPIDDSVDPASGDAWDWFSITSESGGVATVITEGSGDIAIEAYAAGDFSQYLERSDQDMQGDSGNESVTVRLEPGQTVYIKVLPVFASGGAITYQIRAGIM